jgi:hypothetical protein
VALLVVLVAPPAGAQRGWDAQVHAVALIRDSALIGGGVGGGLRAGRGLRVAATVSLGGVSTGGVAGRGEALITYHLTPPQRGGVGLYLGGGLAGEARNGSVRGFAVVLVGAEARPWNGGGWFAEAGIGGGVRLLIGYRLVRLPRR